MSGAAGSVHHAGNPVLLNSHEKPALCVLLPKRTGIGLEFTVLDWFLCAVISERPVQNMPNIVCQ